MYELLSVLGPMLLLISIPLYLILSFKLIDVFDDKHEIFIYIIPITIEIILVITSIAIMIKVESYNPYQPIQGYKGYYTYKYDKYVYTSNNRKYKIVITDNGNRMIYENGIITPDIEKYD